MIRLATAVAWLATVSLLVSCVAPVSPSFIVKLDSAVGLNGSFEIVESGYPVNWSFSESPIQKGEMAVSLDSEIVRDGEQSLRVQVLSAHESAEIFYQVWAKPSFSARTTVEPGKQYRLSFWLRNLGAQVHARWVTASSDYQQHFRHRDMLQGDETLEEWLYVQDTVTVEESEHLLELIFVVSEAGVFWCDNVMVREIGPAG